MEISFDYDLSTIQLVRDIPGRKWNPNNKTWTVPFTPWHSHKVMEILHVFDIDDQIKKCADSDAQQPDMEFPVGLYPFQEESVKFAVRANGRCIIADEMGLGKTITALAFVRMFSEKTLVIAPANVIYKWEDECTKWVDDKSVGIYPTGKGEVGDEDVHIMSYGIMANRYEEIKDIPYDTIIIDEAHKVKNSKSIRTRVTRALVKSGIEHVLFLSGTPFLNRPSELYPLLNMLDPNGYSNFYEFSKRYCGAQYMEGFWYFPPGVVTNVEELVDRLKHIMIRRTKKEVLKQLPELTRTTIPVDITTIKEYKTAVRDIREWLKGKKKEVLNYEHVLTRMGVLRQIIGEGKVNSALELAESVLNDGKKVVLYAHHKDVVERLRKELESYGVGVIAGGVSGKKRFEIIKEFLILDSSLRVIVCSTAGTEGIDLFSASDLIMVERQWTPAMEEQMESRLHRNGQKNAVNVYYLTAKGTYDEKMNKIVETKRRMIGQVISQDEILKSIIEDI